MDKKIGSFADMMSRSGHLVWSEPVHRHVAEDYEDKVLPHLANLKPTAKSTISNHVMSDDEFDHHEAHEAKVARDPAAYPIREYKQNSDAFNKPLRSGPRVKDSIAIGHHLDASDPEHARNKAADTIRQIHGIAKAVSSEIPKDIHAWRGIKPSSEIHRIPPGGHFTDHGFTGTSLDWQQAHGFSGEHGYERSPTWSGRQHMSTGAPPHLDGTRMMARIHIPAGALGHHLDMNGEKYGSEEELLLHRGTQFQVDRHELTPHPRGKGLVHVVHMTVVGQHPHPLVNHFGEPVSRKLVPGASLGKVRTFKESLQESSMKQVGEPLGSNAGGLHEDENGDEHYVKHYRDPEQGRAEVLAGKIYQHMGIKTVGHESRVVNGKHAVTSRWNHDLEPMHHSEFKNLDDRQASQVGKMYHAAVLTKNWDMVGLTHDNILRHRGTGDLHSVDHGGAFHFRAQGGAKDYGHDIEEHHSLRHNEHASGEVFDHVLTNHPHAYEAGRDAVAKMDMSHVHRLFQDSGLKDWEAHHDAFVARRNRLLSAPNS